MLGSFFLHAAFIALLAWAPPLPDVDFELVMPSEVEFGIPQAAEVEPPPSAPPSAPTPVEPAVTPDTPAEKPKPKSKPDLPDAAVADASVDAATPDAATPIIDAAVATDPKPPAPALLSAFAPKGSQISLRLDVALVRASPLSEDVRALLGDAPDFRAVIEGSGIDAVRDLDRLYLASPDLRRENVVIAGQHTSQADLAKRAVASLAAAASKPARWKTREGVMVAPWHDRDETERVVALLSGSQFVITAKKDLPRVLAVARAFDPRQAALRAKDPQVDPASALLALEPGVAGMLTVFDARRFARGNLRGVPTQLEVTTRLQEDGGVKVSIRGELEDADAAEEAAEYWSRMRERFASNPFVALVGMRSPIVSATIIARGHEIVIEGALSQQQARTLLAFARNNAAPANQPVRRSPINTAPNDAKRVP